MVSAGTWKTPCDSDHVASLWQGRNSSRRVALKITQDEHYTEGSPALQNRLLLFFTVTSAESSFDFTWYLRVNINDFTYVKMMQ